MRDESREATTSADGGLPRLLTVKKRQSKLAVI